MMKHKRAFTLADSWSGIKKEEWKGLKVHLHYSLSLQIEVCVCKCKCVWEGTFHRFFLFLRKEGERHTLRQQAGGGGCTKSSEVTRTTTSSFSSAYNPSIHPSSILLANLFCCHEASRNFDFPPITIFHSSTGLWRSTCH